MAAKNLPELSSDPYSLVSQDQHPPGVLTPRHGVVAQRFPRGGRQVQVHRRSLELCCELFVREGKYRYVPLCIASCPHSFIIEGTVGMVRICPRSLGSAACLQSV